MNDFTATPPEGGLILGPYVEAARARCRTEEGLALFVAELATFTGAIFAQCDPRVFTQAIMQIQREAGKGADTESRAIRATCHFVEMNRKDMMEKVRERAGGAQN